MVWEQLVLTIDWDPVLLGAVDLVGPTALSAESDDILTDRQAFLLGSVTLVLIGLFLLYAFVRGPLSRARLLLDAEPFEPGMEMGEDSIVALSGTVSPGEEMLTAPLSDDDAVAYEHKEQTLRYTYKYSKSRRRRMRQRDDEDWDKRTWSWETSSSDTDRVPFQVETEHGHVDVDPTGAQLTMPLEAEEKPSWIRRHFYSAHPFTGNPFLIGRIIDAIPGTDALTPSRPEREVVRHLDPGEETTIVGSATDPRNETENAVGLIEDGEDVDMFRITTESLGKLKRDAIASVVIATIPGIALVVAGIGLFAYALTQGFL